MRNHHCPSSRQPHPHPSQVLCYANVLAAIDAEFAATAHFRVLFDVDQLQPDAPSAAITLSEARRIVCDPGAADGLRDAIWASLIQRVQEDPQRWEVIALWTMLPRLRGIAGRLSRWHVDPADIRSDVVVGFLEAVRAVGPAQPHLGKRLWWRTYGHALQACRRATRELATEDIERVANRRRLQSTVPGPDAGPIHHDQDRAVVEGVRLGSLAGRLGLRRVIDGHVADGCGNDSGEAA